jgi:hypothetical protein
MKSSLSCLRDCGRSRDLPSHQPCDALLQYRQAGNSMYPLRDYRSDMRQKPPRGYCETSAAVKSPVLASALEIGARRVRGLG